MDSNNTKARGAGVDARGPYTVINVYARRCVRRASGARCCLPDGHIEGACRFRCSDPACRGRELPASVHPHEGCSR